MRLVGVGKVILINDSNRTESRENRQFAYNGVMVPYLENRRAWFDYEILDRLEAGLVLTGFEVKSVRAGRGNIAGSRVLIRGGEVFLVGAEILPYQVKNTPPDYEPDRTRHLLLSTEEIKRLTGKIEERGLTLVPISVYNKNGRIKVEIALARGKKVADKRESIKRREADRDIRRTLKRG